MKKARHEPSSTGCSRKSFPQPGLQSRQPSDATPPGQALGQAQKCGQPPRRRPSKPPKPPTLGGVDSKQALFTYWTLGTQGMVGVEFLTGLGQLPEKVFFVRPGEDQGLPRWPRPRHRALLMQAIRSAERLKSKCLSPELCSRQPHYDGSGVPHRVLRSFCARSSAGPGERARRLPGPGATLRLINTGPSWCITPTPSRHDSISSNS